LPEPGEVIIANPALLEQRFNPGFMMVIDGRAANVHWLRQNLKRQYIFRQDKGAAYSTFEAA
jgi:hypothetical protein